MRSVARVVLVLAVAGLVASAIGVPVPVGAATSPPVIIAQILPERHLINSSFAVNTSDDNFHAEAENGTLGVGELAMIGWSTTHSPGGGRDRPIETWGYGFGGVSHSSHTGNHHIELNAYEEAAVYQDLCVLGGETVTWSFFHAYRNGSGTDNRAEVTISDPDDWVDAIPPATLLYQSPVLIVSPPVGAWVEHTGSYTAVAPGPHRFAFSAIPTPGTPASFGNHIDDATVAPLDALVEFYDTDETSGVNVVADSEDESYYMSIFVSGQVGSSGAVLNITPVGDLDGEDYVVAGVFDGTGAASSLTAVEGAGGVIAVTLPTGTYDGDPLSAITIELDLADTDPEPAETGSFALSVDSGTALLGDADCVTDARDVVSFSVADNDSHPELTFTKSVASSSADPLFAGGTITYDFVVLNSGNVTIADVEVEDSKLGGVVCDSSTDPGLASLASGASLTCSRDYVVTQADVDAGHVGNSASVSGADPDGGPVTDISDAGDEAVETPDGAGNTDSDPTNDPTVFTVVPDPSLTFTKSVAPSSADPLSLGGTIVYDFTVLNSGNVTVEDVVVEDSKFGGVVCDSSTEPALASLAPGESVTCNETYVVTQTDVDAGYVANSASVSGTDPDGGPVTDTSDAGDETVETEDGLGNTDGDPTNDPTVFTVGKALPDESLDNPPDGVVTIDPVDNDVSRLGFDRTSVVLIDPETGDRIKTLVVEGEGVWEVDPVTGQVSFTPVDGLSGSPTPITYEVRLKSCDAEATGCIVSSEISLTYSKRAVPQGLIPVTGSNSRDLLGLGLATVLLGLATVALEAWYRRWYCRVELV